MYTGDFSTAERTSFDTYLSSNAHWDTPASNSGRTLVEALHEEEEELVKIGSEESDLDSEQKLSDTFLSENGDTDTSTRPNSVSPSNPTGDIYVSPAASFLSFFHSPTPEPRNPDDQGQVIAGYTLGSIIGYGSSSIIRRASSSSGTIAAVKIIRRADLVKAGNAPQVRKRLQHEAAVWASLSHEHILPLFSAVHTSYADYFFTLYCPAGSLFDILKRDGTPALPQDDAGMMFRQVVRGLRYLHEVARFVHRDMKLENVLVDEMGVCKIGDFGMSRKIGSPDDDDEDQEDQTELISNFMNPGNGMIHRAVSLAAPSPRRPAKSISLHASHIINRHNTTRHRNSTSANGPTHPFQPGSLPYAAPELLLPQTSDALRPHPSQDIWALGVMLYTLLTGRLPFYDTFEPRLQMKILNGTYTVPQGIGRGAERILQGCLERSLAQRWTIAMVDEIAWGVGWGAEGDDAAVIHEEPEEQCPPSVSRSRSRSRPADLEIDTGPGWQQEEPRPRSSVDAASRRSTSRAKRSLSRAPVLAARPSSGRSTSRSVSRHPRSRSPTSSTMTTPVTPTIVTASSSSSSSGPYEGFNDYALEVSPSSSPSSVNRGRRQNKPHFPSSRSPSPSIVPTTPVDGVLLTSPSDMLEHPDELHLDPQSSRGRPTIRSLGSDKASDALKQRVVGFEDEIENWVSQQEDLNPMVRGGLLNPDDPSEGYLEEREPVLMAEVGWQQRSNSSPPTASRVPTNLKEGSGHMEPFLNPSASTSSTNLITRSRSAETGRR